MSDAPSGNTTTRSGGLGFLRWLKSLPILVSSCSTVSAKLRRGRRAGTHTDNTVLCISEEDAGTGVLHDDSNLMACVKKSSTHLVRIILAEPLLTLEDDDGERLNGYGPVKFLIHPMRDMRIKEDTNAFGTHIFQAPSLGTYIE